MQFAIKYVFFLLLILALPPCAGQVPENLVLKVAGKLWDTEFRLERLEKTVSDPGSGNAFGEKTKPAEAIDVFVEKQPGETTGTMRPEIPPAVKSSDEIFVLYADQRPAPSGYCFASSAPGRYENFEYFILYDPALVVAQVKVWKYRSTHGGAIAGKRWLRQFSGYSKGALTYGKDVQAISGATISGESLVEEVARAGEIMRGVVKGEKCVVQ